MEFHTMRFGHKQAARLAVLATAVTLSACGGTSISSSSDAVSSGTQNSSPATTSAISSETTSSAETLSSIEATSSTEASSTEASSTEASSTEASSTATSSTATSSTAASVPVNTSSTSATVLSSSQAAVSSMGISSAGISSASSASSIPPIIDGQSAYEQYFRPVLADQACIFCHADDTTLEQSPLFMHSDRQFAENELLSTSKVNFLEPGKSRIVQKIRSLPIHNCGTSIEACKTLAQKMEDAIANWAANNDASALFAKSTIESLPVLASEQRPAQVAGRKTNGLFAQYTFTNCDNNRVTNNADPSALPLEMKRAAKCVAGEGLYLPLQSYAIVPGFSDTFVPRAVAAGSGSQQFSVEAWIRAYRTPLQADVGAAFALSRNEERTSYLTAYTFNDRSVSITGNLPNPFGSGSGSNAYPPGDMWHLLVSHAGEGETRTYINGIERINSGLDGVSLEGWDNQYDLYIGGIRVEETEEDDDPLRQAWEGTMGYLAVYDQAFTAEEAATHAAIRPSTKNQISFDISNLTGVADTYIRFDFNVIENQAYNFAKPTLITPEPLNIAASGLQLTVNGRAEPLGQSFGNLNVLLADNGQVLSLQNSTLLPIEQGVALDEFSITFDRFASQSFNRQVLNYERPSTKPLDAREAEGLKIYNRLYATFAALTGVDVANTDLREHFAVAYESLPTGSDYDSLTATQMISTANLANLFCEKMMAGEGVRDEVYKTFNFATPVSGQNFNNLVSDTYQHFARGRSDLLAIETVTQSITPMVEALKEAALDNETIATSVCSVLLSSPIAIAY